MPRHTLLLVACLLALGGCRRKPESALPAGGAAKAADCPADIPAAQAEADYARATQLIEASDEHDAARPEILDLLRPAAQAGHRDAQWRFGTLVVGYWLTDLMFWPDDRQTAVTALAMLRVAVSRGAPAEDLAGLGRTPPVLDREPWTSLDPEWVRLAVEEADRWERCHPGLVK